MIERTKSAGRASAAASSTHEERRAELVEAAYHLIAEKGIEGLRTRDVAARVGINISTLHYHFQSKDNLVVGVVEHVTKLFQTLRAPLPNGATSIDELRNMIDNVGYRRKVAPELEIVVNETMLLARRDEAMRATFDSMIGFWRLGVEQIIERCQRDGHIRDDVDPATTASMIVCFLMGATLQLGLRPGLSVDQIADMLLDTLLPGPTSRKASGNAAKKRR